MMHKRNIKFNALQHWRQFVNERLLLLLRAWPVQQDDDRSKTADKGTCADDLKRGRLVGNVNQRQRDIGTGDNGDATVVDPQVISCTRSRTIEDVVQDVPRKQRLYSDGNWTTRVYANSWTGHLAD